MIENIPLSSITNKKTIQFNTIEVPTNGNSTNFTEGYAVVLSSYIDGVSIATAEGSKTEKFVIKISNDDTYYLKFHLPSINSNIMYITFAEKNIDYRDNYKDFTDNLPQAYIDALVGWCNGALGTPTSRIIRTKKLDFTVGGSVSGRVAQPIPFTVTFKYAIGTSQGNGWVVTNDPFSFNNDPNTNVSPVDLGGAGAVVFDAGGTAPTSGGASA